MREIDVGIAQQRCQIVGIRAHACVLKVDHEQAAFVQHQVAAVIVAMAQDARLVRQLLHDARPLFGERRSRGRGKRDAAIADEKVLDEELELPRQLLDVEGHAVRDEPRRLELRAAPLQQLDQRDCLAVQRGVLGRR